MKVTCKKDIFNLDEIIAKKNSVWKVVNKYHSYGYDWYDVENENKKLNLRKDYFNEHFD